MIEFIMSLYYNLAQWSSYFIIFLFLFSFFLINTLFKNKIVRSVSSLLFSIFIFFQIISIYITKSFIGYQFYLHFNFRDLLSLISLFIPYLIIGLFVYLILFFVLYFAFYLTDRTSDKLNNTNSLLDKRFVSLLLVGIFFLIGFKSRFIEDTMTLFPLFITNEKGFREVLKENGLNDYVASRDIKSKKGKNVIIISLESLEKSFLVDSNFYDITPNLRKLKNNWNYIDMKQNSGSGWTSGSLYTLLTGFPAYFGIHGNKIFQNVYHSEISSISKVLGHCGYESTFINGDADFAGTRRMLYTLGFDKVIDKKISRDTNQSDYGLRDKELFKLAKESVDNYKDTKTPFLLVISTTDTHFPDGIYDKRMEKFITPKRSDLEFMIASTDYHIDRFISYLNEKQLLENTVVYIIPDHLKMGDASIFNMSNERGLYIITNAMINDLQLEKDRKKYQIDLPNIVLNGANIKHNVNFLTGYISGDKSQYLKTNRLELTEINTNGLLRYGVDSYIKPIKSLNYTSYCSDTLRYIAHAGGVIDGFKYTNSEEALEFSYKKGFRLFELDIIQTVDGEYVAAHDWKHWKKITKFKDTLPVTRDEFLKHSIHGRYTAMDINKINNWFSNHPDAILVTDKINDPISFSNKFIDKNRLIMELFDMKSVKDGINSGILSAMPSQNIIKNTSISSVKELYELGIKNIAISRRFIQRNEKLLNEYKKFGIKTYAYHINQDNGINEDYTVKYELDNIYGIYADKWSFDK